MLIPGAYLEDALAQMKNYLRRQDGVVKVRFGEYLIAC